MGRSFVLYLIPGMPQQRKSKVFIEAIKVVYAISTPSLKKSPKSPPIG
jgi:hypothetical protein